MTQLQEMIYNVIPSNLLDKGSINELLNIFFKVVDDTCKIASDIPEYVNIETDVLSDDIMKIYLQNIHQVLQDVKEDIIDTGVGGIPHEERKNYCYSDINLGLQSATDATFTDNNSTGLQNISLNQEIVILEFFNGVDTEYNKKVMLVDNTGVDFSTTIQQAYDNNNIIPSELCCSTIPCATSAIPSCSIGSNLNAYIDSYTGTDLAADLLDQMTNPGAVTDCSSKSPIEDLATETPYKIGSNWMYVDFYIGENYINNNLSLQSLSKIGKNITQEHIWSSKNFKQNLGHAKAFYFTYNIIKKADVDVGASDYREIEYIKLEEKRTRDGKLVPFNYIVKSLIHEYIYDKVIKPVSHPVGFNGEYKRILGFNFQGNFCKNVIPAYDVFFVYCIENDTYFDVRDGDGLFGNNGLLAKDFRYDTEIADIFSFEQHNKNYILITLDNGYAYKKDFDNTLQLIDPTGVVVKSFSKSCGLSAITTKIKCNTPTRYLNTVDNDRTEYNTIDPVTSVPADDVYRIDFNNDGALEGGYLSNEHTIVYLTNNVQYHVANGRIVQLDSNNNMYNSLDGCTMLYNGLEQEDITLCKEIIYWHIYMEWNTDHLYSSEIIHTIIESWWSEDDANGDPLHNSFIIGDVNFVQSINMHLLELSIMTDNIDRWHIREEFQDDESPVIIDGEGNYTNPAVQACDTNIDINTFISSYILANGNDNDLALTIADTNSSPGLCVDCTSITPPENTTSGRVLDASTAGSWVVGGGKNTSTIFMSEVLQIQSI